MYIDEIVSEKVESGREGFCLDFEERYVFE